MLVTKLKWRPRANNAKLYATVHMCSYFTDAITIREPYENHNMHTALLLWFSGSVACSRTPQWRYRDRYRCEVCSSIERLRSLMYNIRECEDKVHDICLPHNMRVSHQYTPEASTEYSTVTCSAS